MSNPSTTPVDAATVTDYSDEVDVLVIGFGIAGGSAAVGAAEKGARVLVLERAAEAGGTTAMAGGHFYLGGGTGVQKATGHEDSADEMYKYLMAVSREPDAEKIRAYCDGSVAHFDWIESLGLVFERSFYPEKAVIQPNTEGLMYTGNEKVWPYKNEAVPAPRGHKVPQPGDTGGAKMAVDVLLERAAELGVEIRYETGATALVTGKDEATGGDRVVGATWKRFDDAGTIRARSVVVAAGGFVMNGQMVHEHVPQLEKKPYILGSTYDDGLGIKLGESVGGVTEHMDQAFVTAPVYPPSVLLTGIIVNAAGERFVAEDSYHSRTSGYVLDQPGQKAYLIVDEAHMERPEFPLCPLIDGWETVEEMESALGIPSGKLAATLDRYNKNAAAGEDPDFHKSSEWLASQDRGPWGAFDMTLGNALYAGFTLGGLRTSVDAQVLRADRSVIDGLYASGACASNLAQDGKGYASGTQLGEGSFFGRRAGHHAAKARGAAAATEA